MERVHWHTPAVPRSDDRMRSAEDPDGAPVDHEDLRRRLEASEAALAHWRQLAEQRSAAYDTLATKPAVRLALELKGRLDPLRRRERAVRRRLTGRARLAMLAARSPAPADDPAAEPSHDQVGPTDILPITVIVFGDPRQVPEAVAAWGATAGGGVVTASSWSEFASAISTGGNPVRGGHQGGHHLPRVRGSQPHPRRADASHGLRSPRRWSFIRGGRGTPRRLTMPGREVLV